MPAGLNRLDYWHYSMVCAGYAKWLAESIGADDNQADSPAGFTPRKEHTIGHRPEH